MKRQEISQAFDELKNIQKKIDAQQQIETHLEAKRLLKMIDAELMDALHNMQALLDVADE